MSKLNGHLQEKAVAGAEIEIVGNCGVLGPVARVDSHLEQVVFSERLTSLSHYFAYVTHLYCLLSTTLF